MATITEDYVSFEIAKLLKEKGFDEYCPLWYNLDKPIEGPFFYKEIGWYGHNSYDYNGKRIVSAPTLQMAMRWLREEKHYYIQIMLDSWALDTHLGYYIVIQDILSDFEEINPVDKVFFKTYEEAVEAAIKYCLENLI